MGGKVERRSEIKRFEEEEEERRRSVEKIEEGVLRRYSEMKGCGGR